MTFKKESPGKKGRSGANKAVQITPASSIKAPAPRETAAAAPAKSKKPQFVTLMSKEGTDRITDLVPGRHVCECLATRHKLINNCLECGRIVCQQEGSGPCLFCGTLVCTAEEAEVLQRNSRKSEKLRDKLETSTTASSEAILAHARAAFERVVIILFFSSIAHSTVAIINHRRGSEGQGAQGPPHPV